VLLEFAQTSQEPLALALAVKTANRLH